MVLEKIRSHLTPNVNDTGRRDTGGLKRTALLTSSGSAPPRPVWCGESSLRDGWGVGGAALPRGPASRQGICCWEKFLE